MPFHVSNIVSITNYAMTLIIKLKNNRILLARIIDNVNFKVIASIGKETLFPDFKDSTFKILSFATTNVDLSPLTFKHCFE